MTQELKLAIEKFEVISFDVFDTLLLRPYLTQEDLWRDVGGEELLKERIVADRATYAAATKRGGEHTLDEAYAMMPRQYVDFQSKEESLQRECLMVNFEMLEVWNRAGELGKKRIIASDMYLSEAWFVQTLKEKGLGDYDALYISSARQARKSTGKLFEIVKQDFAGQKILHIGDNAYSDVKMAELAGLSTWHYRNLRDEAFTSCPFLKTYLSQWPSFEKRLQVGALVCGYKLSCGDKNGYWWRLGYFFGGVLGHLYVSWLADMAKAHRIKHLMFVARDGYLLKRMFDQLKTGIRTDYFYAPRMLSVKVCGVIGTDPKAEKERKKILASLSDDDLVGVLPRYRKYLQQFSISEESAVVDGCSSAFSVQRLVEAACGRQVLTFYLRAISPLVNGVALYERQSCCRWQDLSEFLFCSPEAPIDDVDGNGPLYRERVMEQERFRESVFDDVSSGVIEGFSVLQNARHNNGAIFSRQDWLDYFAAFQTVMTTEDDEHLALAQNSWQIQSENFVQIVRKVPLRRRVFRCGILIGSWRARPTIDGLCERFYLFGIIPIWRRVR